MSKRARAIGTPNSLAESQLISDEKIDEIRDVSKRYDAMLLARAEDNKALSAVEVICKRATETGLHRTSPMVAVGGGVFTGLVGFAKLVTMIDVGLFEVLEWSGARLVQTRLGHILADAAVVIERAARAILGEMAGNPYGRMYQSAMDFGSADARVLS